MKFTTIFTGMLLLMMSTASASVDDDARALIAIADAFATRARQRAVLPEAPLRQLPQGESQGPATDTPVQPGDRRDAVETKLGDRRDAVEDPPTLVGELIDDSVDAESVALSDPKPMESLPPSPRDDCIPVDNVIDQPKPVSLSEPISKVSPRLKLMPVKGIMSAVGNRAPLEMSVHTSPSCIPCQGMKRENGPGNNLIHFTYTDAPPQECLDIQGNLFRPTIPCTFWKNAQGKTIVEIGRRTTEQLWEIANRPANHPPNQPEMIAGTFGGTIQGSDKVRALFAFWREKIGEDVNCQWQWSRSDGRQTLNLLHLQEWTVPAMFGTRGRMMIVCRGAAKLPVDQLGFGYSIEPDGTPTFDVDPVRCPFLKNLVIDPNQPDAMTADPMGIFVVDDILLAWNVFSFIKGVFAILWPEVDLVLPANIDAVAALHDDKLTVKFGSAPTIRIVSIFTFTLGVSSVEITDELVRIFFTGSQWIRYKDFELE